MFAVQGVYDGTAVIPQDTIPFREEYEVVITFLKPRAKDKISSFVSEGEMIGYINDIGENHTRRDFVGVSDTDADMQRRMDAYNRLCGLLKGHDVDMDRLKEERLSRQ